MISEEQSITEPPESKKIKSKKQKKPDVDIDQLIKDK